MSLPQNPFTSSTIPSMKKSQKKDNQMQIENVDRISELPDDVLLKILKGLSIEKAVQTSLLSKRWEGVWKNFPYLFFDTRKALKVGVPLAEHSNFIVPLITKVINNHNGNLEFCKIQHFSNQAHDGTLETWIRSLIHVKHTKCLVLERTYCGLLGRKPLALNLPPNIFSHPTLTSLLLSRYVFDFAHAFNNCKNLISLKLAEIEVQVDVLNTVIESCPSLKMMVLEIFFNSRTGCLKIHNNNLKVVHLAYIEIDIEVSAALLDIFSIHDIELASGTKIVLDAPRLPQFSQRRGDVDQTMTHIVYNISGDAQGNENMGHEFLTSIENYYETECATLGVNVDMMNPKEVYMLKEVLDAAWAGNLEILQIFFKHNDVYKKEGESSVDGIQKKRGYSFQGVGFGVKNVCMYNFNGLDENQFDLAASFVIQRGILETLMIETSSLPENKKLAIDIAVEKLMKLPKGNKQLKIEYI